MNNIKLGGACTQAELDAFDGLDDKSKRLFLMWVDRALKAEAAITEPVQGAPESVSPQYAAELGRQVDELESENASLRAVFEAAYGLCMGYDWNNGTAAKARGYRLRLLSAVNAIKEVPDLEDKYRQCSTVTSDVSPVQDLLVDIWFHLADTDDETLRGIADRARALIPDPVPTPGGSNG